MDGEVDRGSLQFLVLVSHFENLNGIGCNFCLKCGQPVIHCNYVIID